jgi:hypothetical protein
MKCSGDTGTTKTEKLKRNDREDMGQSVGRRIILCLVCEKRLQMCIDAYGDSIDYTPGEKKSGKVFFYIFL